MSGGTIRVALSCVFILVMHLVFSPCASAITTLKKIETQEGMQVVLHFDQPVSIKQVQKEFFRDVIQLSLSNVSIYPPKMMSLSGREISKIFAYQYSPKLVRFRLTVKGEAQKFQKRFELKSKGKTLSVRIAEIVADKVALNAAAPAPAVKQAMPPSTQSPMTVDEKQLLERIVKNPSPVQSQTAPEAASKTKPLARGKPLASPWKPIFMFFFVFGVFGVGVLFFKNKLRSTRWLKPFERLGLTKNNKMLEVVSTHYLGPKKSIVVIRVAKKLLVLGVSNESISLISQFASGNESVPGDEVLSEDPLGIPGTTEAFDLSVLTQSNSVPPKPNQAGFFDLLNSETTKPGIRAQIKNKLEGLKPL